MKARAHRSATAGFSHRIDIRSHELTVDEPREHGGEDQGPSPQELLAASLASCTAITMEMYAARKGWQLGSVEVDVDYEPAERGTATVFRVTLRLPSSCSQEEVERLRQIAAKCPVHRTIAGEVSFEDRVELVEPAAG